jgi:hypothetical protein
MAFFLRKALKVDPFRLNLSKSGVGVSAGVTGARVGIRGSDGQPYVYGGRYGLYYRQNLGSSAESGRSAAQSEQQIHDAAEEIAALLEATKDEWLPAINTPADADERTKATAAQIVRDSAGAIMDRLRLLGFPMDSNDNFARAVGQIHSDVVTQIAYPEAARSWDATCDDLLTRAAKEALAIIGRQTIDVQALRNAANRSDQERFNQLLIETMGKLAEAVVLPELKARGLVLEENPLYMSRLSGVVADAAMDEIVHLTEQR